MYQPITEEIDVIGVYKHHQFTPRKFRWRSRIYTVDEITLTSDVKDGGIKKRLYSLVSKGNVYRMSFNREDESWILEEVWCE